MTAAALAHPSIRFRRVLLPDDEGNDLDAEEDGAADGREGGGDAIVSLRTLNGLGLVRAAAAAAAASAASDDADDAAAAGAEVPIIAAAAT